MQPTRQRIGRYTVSIGLIALGAGLLIDNIQGAWSTLGWLLNLWPLVVIGFGLEYLIWAIIYERRNEQFTIRFDFLGAFLLLFVMVVGIGVNTVRWVAARLPEGVVLSELNHVEHSATAPSGGATTLRLNLPQSSVTVLPAHNTGEIEVRSVFQHNAPFPILLIGIEDTNWAEKVKPAEIRHENGYAIVAASRDAAPPKSWVRYVVYVPSGMRIEMDSEDVSITVHNHTGDLALKNRQGVIQIDNTSGNAVLETTNGMIEVSSHYGNVDVASRTGTIRLLSVTGSMKVQSDDGYLFANNIYGPLEARHRNGNIHFSSPRVVADTVLVTGTGQVHVEVHEPSDMKLTAETKVGGINGPFELEREVKGAGMQASLTTGEGTHKLQVEVGTGSIWLNSPNLPEVVPVPAIPVAPPEP